MSGWTKRLDEILEQEVALKGTQIFLVEGQEDVNCFGTALNAHLPNESWDSRWTLTHAGSKDFVLKMLQVHPDWYGLVDRDEWTSTHLQSLRTAYPNLLVLPRYCMESYLIVPHELWAALPTEYRERIPNGEAMLHKIILHKLPQWVRHGVLWSIINPLQHELKTVGFNKHLLEFNNVQDDIVVKQKLLEWSRLLDADSLFQQFQDRLADVQNLTEHEQLTQWVHGKKFWRTSVEPVLTKFLGRRSGDETPYDIELWQHLKLPGELIPIFQAITQPQ